MASHYTKVAGLVDDGPLAVLFFCFCCVLYHASISVENASPNESVSLLFVWPESDGFGSFLPVTGGGGGGGGGGGSDPLAGDWGL